jgi:pentatricopeptide repeat protein
MEVLGHCGYLEEAEAVFVEIKQKNWVPDEPVYGLLVVQWGKARTCLSTNLQFSPQCISQGASIARCV